MSAYPSTFNPNKKVEDPKRYGIPEFEPLLKAGGHWTSQLTVPEEIRETGSTFVRGWRNDERKSADGGDGKEKQQEKPKSVTWVIEIASQILFSNSAVVHFEVLVGRDERSLELGFAAVAGHGHGAPGQVADYSLRDRKVHGLHAHQQKGVYSKAVKLVVEDTEALWDKPTLPKKDDVHNGRRRDDRGSRDGVRQSKDQKEQEEQPIKKKKIHLVVLTHGLHSNIGADMLYLKESIDATVKQARLDARKRKAAYNAEQSGKSKDGQTPPAAQTSSDETSDNQDSSTAPLTGGQEELQDNDDDGSDDEEQTIVRGFTGNAVRTERGIQYLGKRLAKYILHFTYPDQPFLPVKKSMTRSFTDSFKSQSAKDARDGFPAHNGRSIHKDHEHHAQLEDMPYTFTSISFVGHSLGGLIQTYAVAYIQKHAPQFFTQIEPVNFICMASPLLGLSNENPMYVKFALDFGLVGRTGQDLGLTWRAPTIAKSGWSNLVNGFSSNAAKDKQKEADPGAKPLLRILPTGPAHTVLRMFRNRTVYANVVNDGIVPLRTSCLLFLDWRGLGKVDKARRDNGLIGTMAEWGWAELTGANALAKPATAKHGDVGGTMLDVDAEELSGTNTPTQQGRGETVPQPSEDVTEDDNRNSIRSASASTDPEAEQFLKNQDHVTQDAGGLTPQKGASSGGNNGGIIDSFISFLRPNAQSSKVTKAIRRGQTMAPSPSGSVRSSRSPNRNLDDDNSDGPTTPDRKRISKGSTESPTMLHPHKHSTTTPKSKKRPAASRGDTADADALAPPRTSIFESASDILHPPIPSTSWIIDPSSRSRTIFHDRVYHPEDIPPPPTKRPGMGRSFSGLSITRSMSVDSTSSPQGKQPTESSPFLQPAASNATPAADAGSEYGSMRLEEKIARAYHRDLSWRKVLVRLEPDAHNNMIVRRQFANAYGWPVVKHLCDTHFADTWTARMRDEDEAAWDRAQGVKTDGEEVERQTEGEEAVHREEGEEVKAQTEENMPTRSKSEMREAKDELGGLKEVGRGLDRHRVSRDPSAGAGSMSSVGSTVWDEIYFEGTSDDDDDEADDTYGARIQKMVGGWGIGGGAPASPTRSSSGAADKLSPVPSGRVQLQKKKTPTEKRLDYIRTNSGSGPSVSAEMAAGMFVPSPSGSDHALSKRVVPGEPVLVAEPDSMKPSEEVDPGNLTPASSGPGMVRNEQESISGMREGESLDSAAKAPEAEWKNKRPASVEGKGFGEAEVGLRKSVESQLTSPVLDGGERDAHGMGEKVARLSSSGGRPGI